MTLYKIMNGFMGDGEVHVLVIAQSETDAVEMAVKAFYEDAQHAPHPGPTYYDKSRFKVEIVCPDVSTAWVSEVDD